MKELIFTRIFKDNALTLIIDCFVNKINNDLIFCLRGNLNTDNCFQSILEDMSKINLSKYNSIYLDITYLEKIIASNLNFLHSFLEILMKNMPITIIYKQIYMQKLITSVLSILNKSKVRFIYKGD